MPFLVAIPPLVIIGLIVALGLAVTARPLSEGITAWLKDAGRLASFALGVIGPIAVRLTQWITHHIGAEFRDLERLGVAWFSGLYQWCDLVITNAIEWPLWLWRFERWLLFVKLPSLVKALPHLAGSVVHYVTRRVVTIERTIVKLPKLTKAQATALISAVVAKWIHPYLASLRWVRSHFAALTRAIEHALPIPTVPTFPNIWKRIRRLERRLAPAAIGALVIAALGRLGLGWIRCNRVKKLGRSVCGMDDTFLDQLLLGALAIFGTASVVEFAEGLEALEDEALGILGAFVREWPR